MIAAIALLLTEDLVRSNAVIAMMPITVPVTPSKKADTSLLWMSYSSTLNTIIVKRKQGIKIPSAAKKASKNANPIPPQI